MNVRAQPQSPARRGAPIPPIEVYRVAGLHFVTDGHHRVSIALAAGQDVIDAYVTEMITYRPARGVPGEPSGAGA